MSHNSYKLTWLYFKEIPFKASKDSPPVRYGTDVLNFTLIILPHHLKQNQESRFQTRCLV